MKDFLFLNYQSWEPDSCYLFDGFKFNYYSCDYVEEKELENFIPNDDYKLVVVYVNELYTVPYLPFEVVDQLNIILNNNFKNSFVVLFDNTDSENIDINFDRCPDLIIKRELTDNTKTKYNTKIVPQHFCRANIYNPKQPKHLDIVFTGTPTHPRRDPFVEKLVTLSKTSLKHLNWGILYGPNRDPNKNIKIFNDAKIGLHYPGNSYDSWRIWEYASAGLAILSPNLPLKSIAEDHQYFNEYLSFNTNLSDLEEKIVYMLTDDNWQDWGKRARFSFLLFHTPEKCFEHFHNQIISNLGINEKKLVYLDADVYFYKWRTTHGDKTSNL